MGKINMGKLIRTSKNYYDTLKEIKKGSRMTTAAEELKITLSCKTQEDIKKNYYDENTNWAWIWTSTALRKPKGEDNVIVKNGKKYWKRILVVGDKKFKTVLIPEGTGRIVSKWNKNTGLPLETREDTKENRAKIHTHFWFNPGLDEVAVGLNGGGYGGGHGRCLDFDADYDRSGAGAGGSFRLVRGSVKVEKHKCVFICETCGKENR